MSSAMAGSQALVEAYEQSLSDEARGAAGVHYTPPALARFLVGLAFQAVGGLPRTICDPTCGAGSFLLAAAEMLADQGVDPVEIVEHRLVGGELDPGAAVVARIALQRWVVERVGREVHVQPRIDVGDTLLRATEDWAARPLAGFDLVIGNPPFLSQLASRTARSRSVRAAVTARFGSMGAYVDSAALFLLGSLDLVRTGGVVAMIQPQSFLAASDAAAVRSELCDRADLVGVWSSDEQLFDASVRVCAPVLRRRAPTLSSTPTLSGTPTSSGSSASGTVTVHWGRTAELPDAMWRSTEPAPVGEDSWGPLFASARGLPRVHLHGGLRLGSLATATAGFRDEFYALCAASVDLGASADRTVGESADAPRLITVGMIDPGRSSWGERARRFGGRSQLAPVLDLAALTNDAPRVATWAAKRRVPKVLVATQTRVVEAVADPLGDWIPVTPTISVEPIVAGAAEIQGATAVGAAGAAADGHDTVEAVWRLTAALLAPPVSARALATHLGAGLSPGALRWSARSVLQIELPVHEPDWQRGAVLARQLAVCAAGDRPEVLSRLGATMCRAHGLDSDDAIFDWWLQRAVRSSS